MELPSGGDVDDGSSLGKTCASSLMMDVSDNPVCLEVNLQVDHPVAHPTCRFAAHVIPERFEFVFELAGRETV